MHKQESIQAKTGASLGNLHKFPFHKSNPTRLKGKKIFFNLHYFIIKIL